MRDKLHMESVEIWAEFVRTHPISEWKKSVNALIDATYEKSDNFYSRLKETEKGREILERLMQDRLSNTKR